MSRAETGANGSTPLRRIPIAATTLAAPLCLLALLPWLLAAQGDADTGRAEAWALGTATLVAYPVLLVGLLLVTTFLRRHGKLPDGSLARRTGIGLFVVAGLQMALSVAMLLSG